METVKIELTLAECESLLVFMENDLIPAIRSDREIGNIEFLCDLIEVYKKVEAEVR